ncbi:unnamed protein product [Peronospora farinosa]|uniref:Uncharacterized protein n=1 Tax=Peronospora farinosa TaxID=134698 RepID=A0ABN8CEI8_9STRA|nr:unnamed protein product [Peronospora farinosa]
MMPLAPRMLLPVAMTGRSLGRSQSSTLHLFHIYPTIHDYRVMSVLLSRREARRQKSAVQTPMLRRSMSLSPPSGSEKHEKRQREMKEKTAAKLLREKLKKDMDTAKGLAMHQVINVPNVITAARIVATPYLAYLIVQGDHVSAIGLLAVAGVSDWLDGFIARTFRQESIVGSFLDPFADKLLIGTLSFSMMWTGLLPLPLAALILGRDGMLIGGTFYHRLKTKDESSGVFDTSDSGAFQVKPCPPDLALNLLFGLVGTTTFLSGSEYLYGYITKTGAFKPLPKAVERPIRKAVERTEAVLERTEAVVKRTKEVIRHPLEKAVRLTKERLKK